MTPYPYLQGDDHAITAWWKSLEDHRGERAVLRRVAGPEEVMFSQAFFHFLNAPGMSEFWSEQRHLMASAMVAGLLAKVREDRLISKNKKVQPRSLFAQSLAEPRQKGENAPVSELRFSALQKSRDVNTFFTRMSRMIALLRGNVPILSLANDVIHWEREMRIGKERIPMNRLAVIWAGDYFAALPA